MAASIDWRAKCNEHPIFMKIRENKDKDKLLRHCKNLLAVRNNELFVYDEASHCILTTNLHCFGEDLPNKSTKRKLYQVLSCGQPLGYEVESILFNATGSHLALFGQNGLAVLELPPVRGKYGEFAGGDKITCRVIHVAQRYFVTNEYNLLHMAWHPGSPTDLHLTLLTSDDVIRIYNLVNPEQPEQVIPLGNTDIKSPSRLSVQQALGDCAVSFDFGPLREFSRKYKYGEEGDMLVWPIYVLWGNGGVSLIYSSIEKVRMRFELHGPLTMYPAADDNYGTDACSIACIHSTPTVLIIATREGKLHHCLLLGSGDVPDSLSDDESDALESSIIFDTLPLPSLYVYESVELELSLMTVSLSNNEFEGDDFTCPLRLHKDSNDRYHCSHSAGVHTIVLPWIHDVQSFVSKDNDGHSPEINQEKQAIVEHLICTKPRPTSPALPVLGLGVVTDRVLGATLLCLTGTLQCVSLPLHGCSTHVQSAPLLSSTAINMPESPLKHLQQEPFDRHIRRILQRNSSNPVIMTEGKTEHAPQECFQLLARATQVFREEYIQRLDRARQEIEKRVGLLAQQKERQREELQLCLQSRNILTDRAGELAEQFEDCKDKQTELLKRAEKALQILQSRAPILTDAERSMSRELKVMEAKVTEYKSAVQQLKVKQQYQTKQISKLQNIRPKAAPFSKKQSETMRTLLKAEGDEISELVKKVENLKTNIEGHT